jgi:hypothetical protein
MSLAYYDSTHLPPTDLASAHRAAKGQEAAVLAVFYAHGGLLSPSRVLALSGLSAPLTSIRRAMTNLTEDGQLVKTDLQRTGPYGKPEHLWRLPAGQIPLFS